jgi:hypothetical protein
MGKEVDCKVSGSRPDEIIVSIYLTALGLGVYLASKRNRY